ncbi:hypothetical protein COB21_04630, partial [Candidatus Aerophobetes bacterium]
MKLLDISTDFFDQTWGAKCLGRDSSSAYDIFSKNVIIDSPIGYEKGAQSLKVVMDFWFDAFPDAFALVDKVEDYGHVLVSKWRACGTHLGTFQGIAPTQKKIFYSGETVFVFNDKKEVIHYISQLDLYDIFSQLGAAESFTSKSSKEILWGNLKLLVTALKKNYLGLTQREIECCSLFISGFSSKQIGLMLCISHRTVEAYLEKGKFSLNCASRIQMIEKFLVE